MAKKKGKKKKAAPRTSAKKSAPKKKRGAKRSAARASSLAPKPVKTGRGATPMQIGRELVDSFNRGQIAINDKLWSPKIVSVEGLGVESAWHGRKAVDAKNAWWNEGHVIHGASAEGPYVGASGFAVKFRMDVEERATGTRQLIEEIGTYSVKDGKIVREEFMYFLA
ncbi:MAG: nuclear transport factor 2 family protein [Phycisphaeraceae bacterium]|nr:nuclear transport factor 2 family protein [Phycisphaeraceae bacterium]